MLNIALGGLVTRPGLSRERVGVTLFSPRRPGAIVSYRMDGDEKRRSRFARETAIVAAGLLGDPLIL
jgi:hypothetical protein